MTQAVRARNAKPKIEQAAIALFISEGIDAATTRRIAELAGVSEGALYRHYKGKDELAEALFLSIHQKMSELLIAAALSANELDARVSAVVSAYCKLADEEWNLCCYHLLNINRFIKNDVKRNDDPVTLTETLIQELMNTGAIPKGDPPLLAAMCLGVVMQAGQNKIYGRLDNPMSDYEDALTKGIIAILRHR